MQRLDLGPLRLDLGPLHRSILQYADAAGAIEAEAIAADLDVHHGRRVPTDLNDRLALTERLFLGGGLPRRKWFRNVLVAPHVDTGYEGVSFPGVREAADGGDRDGAQKQLRELAECIADAAINP